MMVYLIKCFRKIYSTNIKLYTVG